MIFALLEENVEDKKEVEFLINAELIFHWNQETTKEILQQN